MRNFAQDIISSVGVLIDLKQIKGKQALRHSRGYEISFQITEC